MPTKGHPGKQDCDLAPFLVCARGRPPSFLYTVLSSVPGVSVCTPCSPLFAILIIEESQVPPIFKKQNKNYPIHILCKLPRYITPRYLFLYLSQA